MTKRITTAKLDRLIELRERSSELAAKKRAIDDEAKTILADCEADLQATGRDKTKRGKYVLFWKVKKAAVAWKQAYVKDCGADAANELVRRSPEKKTVDVRAA